MCSWLMQCKKEPEYESIVYCNLKLFHFAPLSSKFFVIEVQMMIKV